MSSSLVLIGALLLALMTACSGEDNPNKTMPTPGSSASASVTVSAKPSTLEPSPTCGPLLSGEVSETGSGFVVELNIMSGNPNPAWRLTNAEGAELRRLLRATRERVDVDGPDELGGYGVAADGRAVAFLSRLGLPPRFWVQGDAKIADFLGETIPCRL